MGFVWDAPRQQQSDRGNHWCKSMAPKPKRVNRKPLSPEELAMMDYWPVKYVARKLGVERNNVDRKLKRLIQRGFAKPIIHYWNAGGKVNDHFLIHKERGITLLMTVK